MREGSEAPNTRLSGILSASAFFDLNLYCLDREMGYMVSLASDVAQVSKPAKDANTGVCACFPTPCRLGSRRHSRIGNLRYDSMTGSEV
jgi:hypothetical protein